MKVVATSLEFKTIKETDIIGSISFGVDLDFYLSN